MRDPSLGGRLLTQTIGHGLGVVGAMLGLDAIATTINPHFIGLFPFEAVGIGLEQNAAAVVGLAFIAVAAWLVWAQDYRRRRSLAALSRRPPSKPEDNSDK